jgi:UPF0716 protein FxsA
MGKWFLIFFLTPIVEMYLLIEVGGIIGAWPTIGLVMLTAMIGITLLRRQGFATLTRGMQRLEGGELPAREMAEGILLAVAGALLLTPGFVTDVVGFALLTPPIRAGIGDRMLNQVRVVSMSEAGFRGPPDAGDRPRGQTIEGDFERKP